MFVLEDEIKKRDKDATYVSTKNACKLCNPLGASVAFKGIKGCLPLLHGSQGCATYIRRYTISHFREPMDIASSNFSEESTIFGGAKNFCIGIDNIRSQYNPQIIAISSTCLSETIGENVPGLIAQYRKAHEGEELPEFIYASTPSYQGTHIDGFHEAVYAMVSTLGKPGEKTETVNIMPGFVSPEDMRNLKDIFAHFGVDYCMLPDYSDTLDNPMWDEYQRIPEGGTSVEAIQATPCAKASIEFGYVFNKGGMQGKVKNNKVAVTAGQYLEKTYGVKNYSLGLPIGIRETDAFFSVLSEVSGKPVPERYVKERGRLVDSYIDAHKHLFGVKAALYGEEDLVIAMASFLLEIGMIPTLVASGGESGRIKEVLAKIAPDKIDQITVVHGADFETIAAHAKVLKPDMFIGNSKAYYITREMGVPLIRVAFPIHDRFGGQRVAHLGYTGTQQLFDRIVNAIIERKQESSPVGYKYL